MILISKQLLSLHTNSICGRQVNISERSIFHLAQIHRWLFVFSRQNKISIIQTWKISLSEESQNFFLSYNCQLIRKNINFWYVAVSRIIWTILYFWGICMLSSKMSHHLWSNLFQKRRLHFICWDFSMRILLCFQLQAQIKWW